MTLRKPDGRGSGVNVIGAISEKQGLVHYTILREFNKPLLLWHYSLISEIQEFDIDVDV